jgi:hypothetical protein
LTRIDKQGERLTLYAPFSTPHLTLEIKTMAVKGVKMTIGDRAKNSPIHATKRFHKT